MEITVLRQASDFSDCEDLCLRLRLALERFI